MRYLLVVNPASGGGRNLPRLEKVLKYFAKKGDQVEVHWTAGPGDGQRVVRQRARGFDAVIGAGGDGTIHEVIGALAATGTPLGILPWGTGNVFAREMGLPRRVKALCRIIRKGRWRALDLGLADGKPFLLMASVGLDAYALGHMAGPQSKRRWGLGAYVWAALGALARYRHPEVEVRLDGGVTDRGTFVVVSNTRLYGAFFTFHPKADPYDGFLDVLVFRDQGRWKFLGMVARMVWHRLTVRDPLMAPEFLGRHGIHRTRRLEFVPGGTRAAQVDGEFLPEGIREVGITPGALRVLLPRAHKVL